ncbi:MAG: ribosome silencing factor [Candidatus Aureabacteria bacterium]|nr:ribosome silencing factor [Candidatus Auribacterota bacterium]
MDKIKKIFKEIEESALDKKGQDIVVLDVRKLSDITDYYFIISASNDRQIKAIKNEIEVRLKQQFGLFPKHSDGTPVSQWIVVDYTDFIVHIFDENLRQYYELERLWGDAKIKKI